MRNIILIGFMGTGKTKVGSVLAKSLGRKFVDTDRLIEHESRKSIPQIFAQDGEAYFRDLERSVIRRVRKVRNAVIATGGGAVVDPENLKALQDNGFLIRLDASSNEIHSRVTGSKRPLLQGNLSRKRIRELLALRRPYYARADAVINTTGRPIREIASEIKGLIHPHQIDRLRVDLPGRGYEILIGSGILSRLGEQLKRLKLVGKVAIVTNPRIGKLYGQTVSQSLKKSGFTVKTILIPDGERYKTLKWASNLYDALVKGRFERGSCLIALGGGVIGDLVGFTAATFLRGIAYCQIPTSLAAQVDASIGGKTAVNHPKGKNLIGAFYQPRLVLIDTQVLKTLSKREFRSGMAEVIKYGVIADETFFGYLEDRMEGILNLDEVLLRQAIRRSCEIKASVVQEDERESGRRKTLNYGHTLGHAVETAGGYRRHLHGEAVAIGMVFAARLARRLNLCGERVVERQLALIKRTGLPVSLPKIKTADILNIMKLDKKVAKGAIYFVLAHRIGRVGVRPVSQSEILKMVKSY